MRGLKGKIAAVTGGGSGIGRGGAIRLAEEGCLVAVMDWKQDSAIAVADQINKAGGKAIAIRVDVSQESEVEAAFAKVIEVFGRLDILVSNAGIFSAERDGKVGVLQKAVWDEIVGVNLTGMYLACKHGINAIRNTAKNGCVVITGSPQACSASRRKASPTAQARAGYMEWPA